MGLCFKPFDGQLCLQNELFNLLWCAIRDWPLRWAWLSLIPDWNIQVHRPFWNFCSISPLFCPHSKLQPWSCLDSLISMFLWRTILHFFHKLFSFSLKFFSLHCTKLLQWLLFIKLRILLEYGNDGSLLEQGKK